MNKRSTSKKNNRTSKQNSKPVHPALSNELIEEFKQFMEYHPAVRLNRNLRKMLIEFLMYDGATEAIYIRDLLWDLEGLFLLLDAIEASSHRTIATRKVAS